MQPQPADEFDQLDDKEQVGAEPKMDLLHGDGEGEGKPAGKLHAVDDLPKTGDFVPGGASGDQAASNRNRVRSEAEEHKSRSEQVGTKSTNALNRLANSTNRFTAAAKAISGNPKTLKRLGAGGGVLMLIVAGFLLVAQFKLIFLLENIERHFFARNHHVMETREGMFMRNYFADHITSEGRYIDNGTASFANQVYRSFHQGGLEKRLEKKGVKVKVRAGLVRGGKIIEITENGKTTSYNTSEISEKRALGERTSTLASDITQSDNAFKSLIIKGRLTKLVGAFWHPIDPVKGKYQEVRSKVVNGIAEELIKMSTYNNLLGDLVSKLLGGTDGGREVGQAATDAASQAAGDVAAKTVSESVSSAISKLNPIGVWALVADLYCKLLGVVENGDIQKLVKQKTELEQLATFRHYLSAKDQMKEGKTNANTAAALSSTLATKDEHGKTHDFSETNNAIRENEKPVPYTPNDDCSDAKELCEQKLASKRINASTIGRALNLAQGFANNPIVKFMPFSPFNYANRGACIVVTTIVDTINGLLGQAADAILTNNPATGFAWGKIKDGGVNLMGILNKTVLTALIPPLVDKQTSAPDLHNVISAGASGAMNAAAGSTFGSGEDDSQSCYNKSPDQQKDDVSLCGHKLSASDLKEQYQVMKQDDYNDYEHSSVWNKIANIQSPYSVASRIAFAVPSSPSVIVSRGGQTIATAINPKGWLSAITNLPSLLTPKLEAATPNDLSYVVNSDGTDQFANEQVGFTEQEINSGEPGDDGKLHNTDVAVGCSMTSTLANPDTGEPVTQPDECEKFYRDNATQQVCAGDSTPAPDGSTQQLAQEMLSNNHITYWTNNGVNTRDLIVALSQGKPAYTTADNAPNKTATINPNILKFIIEAGTPTSSNPNPHIMVNAITDKTHTSPSSAHYKGEAVDIDLLSEPLSILNPIAQKYGGTKNNESDHHHFDFPKTADDAANPTPANSPEVDCSQGVAGNGTLAAGSRSEVEQRVLANSLLQLNNSGSQTGDLKKSVAAGGVSDDLVRLMASIMEQGKFKLPVNALRSDHHNDGPNGHYGGFAIDIGYNSSDPTGKKLYKWLYTNYKELHIRQMIFDMPPDGLQCIGQVSDSGDGAGKSHPVDCQGFYKDDLADHKDHIHVGVFPVTP
jgi:hypothetical protein